MPAIISVVGRKKSGKTTLIEGLVRELRRRGYRVATIKHHRGEFQLDLEGKDSWRHARAGAELVGLASPGQFALIHRWPQEAGLAELAARHFGEVDLLLAEGYKGAAQPKVEVLAEGEVELSSRREHLLAVVGGGEVEPGLPRFAPQDYAGLADLIERWLLRRRGSEAGLVVEGREIVLGPFARSYLSATVRGMISVLKGVAKRPRRVLLWLEEPGGDGAEAQKETREAGG